MYFFSHVNSRNAELFPRHIVKVSSFSFSWAPLRIFIKLNVVLFWLQIHCRFQTHFKWISSLLETNHNHHYICIAQWKICIKFTLCHETIILASRTRQKRRRKRNTLYDHVCECVSSFYDIRHEQRHIEINVHTNLCFKIFKCKQKSSLFQEAANKSDRHGNVFAMQLCVLIGKSVAIVSLVFCCKKFRNYCIQRTEATKNIVLDRLDGDLWHINIDLSVQSCTFFLSIVAT